MLTIYKDGLIFKSAESFSFLVLKFSFWLFFKKLLLKDFANYSILLRKTFGFVRYSKFVPCEDDGTWWTKKRNPFKKLLEMQLSFLTKISSKSLRKFRNYPEPLNFHFSSFHFHLTVLFTFNL